MKMLRILLIVVITQFFVGSETVWAEIIYTKDGEVIQAKTTEKTETTIWYKEVKGDIVEEIGLDINDIEKILNDDGSVSKYRRLKRRMENKCGGEGHMPQSCGGYRGQEIDEDRG